MSKPAKPKPVKTVMFYTRSDEARNRQMVVIKVNKRQYRFSEGQMKSELVDYNLSEEELSDIETRAYQKVMSFVPEVDKYLIDDSTGYYSFTDVETDGIPSVTRQAQIDLDRIQNLLSEFQAAIGSLPD